MRVRREVPRGLPVHIKLLDLKGHFESDTWTRLIEGRGALYMRETPYPSFPCFFGKRRGKPPKKQGFFIPTETLKSQEKKRKNAQKNKEILTREKKQGIPKKRTRKGRTGQVQFVSNCLRWHICRAKFGTKDFFSSYEFSYEKCSEIFPEIFEALFCGSEKIPENSLQISH